MARTHHDTDANGRLQVHCPRCRHAETKVLESRVSDGGRAVRRRRECCQCRERWTTYERGEAPDLMVRKHDGSDEPFQRVKLLNGLTRACSKRGVAPERLESLATDLEASLRAQGSAEVSSRQIGDRALRELARLDAVAYLRFASVYRSFDDVHEFARELERLGERPGEPAAV